MVLVYLALLVGILITNRVFYKGRIMPVDIFTVIWCVFAGTASIGAYGYYRTELLTNAMVITVILVFNIVYTFVYCYKNKNEVVPNEFSADKLLSSVNINFWLIIIINVVFWIYSSLYLGKTIEIIRTEGFAALRGYAYSYDERNIISTHAQLFFTWAVQPAFVATMSIAAAALLLKIKRRFIYLGISVIDIIIYTLLFGGRGTIMKLISLLVLTTVVVGGAKLFKLIKKHIGITFILIIAFLTILVLTVERSISNATIFQNFYTYVSGPFIYLQQLLVEHPLSTTQMFWGAATFGCITTVIVAVCKIFLGIDIDSPEGIIPQITANYLDIGNGVKMNSMTTMIYPFLRDFGYAGLVIGPSIFAVFVALIFRNYEKKRTLRSLCVLTYVLHTLVFSVQNFTYFKLESLSIILFIILFTTKFKLKNGILKTA